MINKKSIAFSLLLTVLVAATAICMKQKNNKINEKINEKIIKKYKKLADNMNADEEFMNFVKHEVDELLEYDNMDSIISTKVKEKRSKQQSEVKKRRLNQNKKK